MIRFVFTMLLCAILTATYGQKEIKQYVKKNNHSVTAIDPDSTDCSDLKAIGDAIGDKRIVMLGEQDHGDAPAFLAKSRLVKYLHEEKGFNVLAFESDFFGMNEGWDRISKEDDELTQFIGWNIFTIWSRCDACSDLFYQTIPKSYQTANPITLTGFDSQLYLAFSSKNLVPIYDSVLKALDIPYVQSDAYRTDVLSLLDSICCFVKLGNPEQYDHMLKGLQTIREELQVVLDTNDFWYMLNENIIAFAGQLATSKEYIKSSNIRDAQMARNLRWLAEVKYPNEKIIVWAHNAHISDNSTLHTPGCSYMGTVFRPYMPDETYILGFTSYSGEAGRLINPKTYKVLKPMRNSFERWIDPSLDYAFVDFDEFNRQYPDYTKPFHMKGVRHRSQKAQWTKIYDGMFFIREMYPCKSVWR